MELQKLSEELRLAGRRRDERRLGRFFAALCTSGVEFILVGSTAANVQGAARLTRNVERVYRRTRQDVARLAAHSSHPVPTCAELLLVCHSAGILKTIWRGSSSP